jgi:hypothetical protein
MHRAERVGSGNRQHPARLTLQRARCLLGGFRFGDDAGAMPIVCRASLCERDSARRTMKQSHAEAFLEPLNMGARGGLRDSQAAGGRREAPGLYHAREGCDAIEWVHPQLFCFQDCLSTNFRLIRGGPPAYLDAHRNSAEGLP